MPERVQMHRRKGGWRKDHPDAVIVDRTNPDFGNPFPMLENTQAERRRVVDLFSAWFPKNPVRTALARHYLKGRDLACWCPPDQPCHADVLLKIANS